MDKPTGREAKLGNHGKSGVIVMYRFLLTLGLLAALLVAPLANAAKDDFPGRALYPDVTYMELSELQKRFKDVVIVDARSKYEFNTIHITGAHNILVSKTHFGKKVKELRARTDKPIVFYCNGHTCMKSYKATRRAQAFGVKNVYAFDAGIFDWAKANPDRTVLLGRSPIKVSDLISKKKLKARMLEPEAFQARVENRRYLVLDVRSSLQRAGSGLFAFVEKHASLDNKEKLDRYIDQAKQSGRILLAYDAVGKQVRWFQYYLEKKGLKKYYFMKGGAEGYYKLLAKQQKGYLAPKASVATKR